jgi:hypothetical protein
MVVERQPGGTRLLDVLDRILDKGIVIDAWIRFQLVGLDLITIDARVVVASIDTYLNYAESLRLAGRAALPEMGAAQAESGLTRRRTRTHISPRAA